MKFKILTLTARLASGLAAFLERAGARLAAAATRENLREINARRALPWTGGQP